MQVYVWIEDVDGRNGWGHLAEIETEERREAIGRAVAMVMAETDIVLHKGDKICARIVKEEETG